MNWKHVFDGNKKKWADDDLALMCSPQAVVAAEACGYKFILYRENVFFITSQIEAISETEKVKDVQAQSTGIRAEDLV